MKKLMLIWFVLNLTILSGQTSQQAAFEEGNKFYQNKEYRKAIEQYELIANNNLESTALYFNMGNAYYKTNQLAMAILYYERALQLSPHDDDVKQNLAIAREKTIDRFETVPQPLVRTAYLGILKALTPGSWAALGVLCFLFTLAGTYLYLFTSRRRPGFVLGSVTLLLGLLALFMALGHQTYLKNNKPAVVVATSSYVKSGPSTKAEDVFILHEGTSAVVTEDFDGWKKIKLPDGKVGWIESADLIEV